jgi:uncharacterized protein
MIKREAETLLAKLSEKFPVLTITGPKQSGKTFLAKSFFKDKKYFNLEDIELRDLANEDPKAFLAMAAQGAIIDEIQYAPSLLSFIQVKVDENRDQKAQFILTGSQQLSLMGNISQSLAGRTAILNLLPCSIRELRSSIRTKIIKPFKEKFSNKDFLIFNGFYPGIFRDQISPSIFYANHIRTYLERDLNQLSQIQNLSLFRKFIKSCASRIGQVLNQDLRETCFHK